MAINSLKTKENVPNDRYFRQKEAIIKCVETAESVNYQRDEICIDNGIDTEETCSTDFVIY